jgi:hypothetical protein
MSLPLRVRWAKQLDAAQLDPSWQAHIEVRVLRFLLARYSGAQDVAPLPTFPFYEGSIVPGRAKMPLAQREQRRRLEHISLIGSQIPPDFLGFIDRRIQRQAWDSYQRRQRHEKLQQAKAPESLASSQWLWRDASEYVFTLLVRLKRPPR